MAVNKVIFDGKILLDLTGITVTPETLAEGVTAIDAAGRLIVGTAKFAAANTSAVLGEAVLGTMMLGKEN